MPARLRRRASVTCHLLAANSVRQQWPIVVANMAGSSVPSTMLRPASNTYARGHRLFRRRAGSSHARRQPGSPAPAGNAGESWTFSKQGQAECAEFIADRKVDVERLFTHRWWLEQAEEAYRLFDTQTTGKAVILPS